MFKHSIEFEITDWKKVFGDVLKNWNCEIKVSYIEDKIKAYGSKHFLWNAIDNLIVNAVEALRNIKQSGLIDVSLELKDSKVLIIIKSNGPPISPLSQIEYIQEIITSSGDLDELTSIDPPAAAIEGKGKHLHLGLKVTTWIIVGIHKGRIKLISKKNESPCFEIILPTGEQGE